VAEKLAELSRGEHMFCCVDDSVWLEPYTSTISLKKISEPLPFGVEVLKISDIRKKYQTKFGAGLFDEYFIKKFIGPQINSTTVVDGFNSIIFTLTAYCQASSMKSHVWGKDAPPQWWGILHHNRSIMPCSPQFKMFGERELQNFVTEDIELKLSPLFKKGRICITPITNFPIHYAGKVYRPGDIITFNLVRDVNESNSMNNYGAVSIDACDKRVFIPANQGRTLLLVTSQSRIINDKSFTFEKLDTCKYYVKDRMYCTNLYKAVDECEPSGAVFVDSNSSNSVILPFPVYDNVGFLRMSYKDSYPTLINTSCLRALWIELRGKSFSQFKITSMDGILTEYQDDKTVYVHLNKNNKSWLKVDFDGENITISPRDVCR
jgi:hypothetical protein